MTKKGANDEKPGGKSNLKCIYESDCEYIDTCKYSEFSKNYKNDVKCKSVKACKFKITCERVDINLEGEGSEGKYMETCKYRAQDSIETYRLYENRIFKIYCLEKWSNKNSRSRVGVICTIGPSVFDPKKKINKVNELIKEGMNIARINLSHCKLKEGSEEPNDDDKDEILKKVKAIRRCSDGLRIPVNIMLDLKGPEIRVKFFSVPDLKKLEPTTSLEIKEGLQFTVVLTETGKQRITVNKPVLSLPIKKDAIDDFKKKDGEYCLSVKHKTDITVKCEGENGDNGFDFMIMKIHNSKTQDFKLECQDKVEICEGQTTKKSNSDEENELPGITGLYKPVLRIEEGDKLYLTADEKWSREGDESVIYLDYDGQFGKDIANHNMKDPIYLDDGKASFELIDKDDRNHPRVRVVYGEKVELRKSMNLFNNTCDSAEFVSKIDRTYLKLILSHEEFNNFCPVDSIAVSFVRKSSDLDRIDTILEEYGAKKKKNWNIKLVAKIESPHCFMKRYVHNKERFNQEAEIDYAEYEKILDNRLCWAVMVARGDLGVEIKPEKVPLIQQNLTDIANIAGKGVIVATQMLLSMVHNKRPSRADVTDIHNAVLSGADVVMLSEETAKGDYPIEALKCMRSIVNEAVDELMIPKNREIYLKKILESKKSKKTNEIMDLLGEPMVNISLKSGSPVIFSYALTGGTVTKIPKYRPDKPIVAITNSEMAARNMLFYFGVFPLLFVGKEEPEKKENSNQKKAEFDFPRNVKKYREFLKAIIDTAIDEKNGFFFEKLKDITDGQIVFGLLGIDKKSSYLSDRAIVIFRYEKKGKSPGGTVSEPEKKGNDKS